ncbi:MAG TPA: glycosyltransferase family 87 protein, partial [Candidatus Acidoferrales bacterium]|nr:glycosyltransferase family 87 protein [Candidatus Acidoferrales bacterium]
AFGPTPGGVAASTVGRNLAITQQVWLYPPQTAFLFAPFGALPLEIGIPLLHLFVLVSALVGIAAMGVLAGLRDTRLAFALTLAVISQPFVISVRNGHPVGLLLIGGGLLLVGVADRRDLPTAIGVALLSIKPQIVLPILLFAPAYALIGRDPRRVLVMIVAGLAVTLPAWLVTPFPLGAVAASSAERLAVDLSTLSALSRDLGGGDALTGTLMALTIVACALAAVWARVSRRVTVAAGLFLLSLALVPYAHDYDMLLVLPGAFAALVVATRRTERATSALVVFSLVLAPWVLFYWWPIAGETARRFQGGPLGAVPLIMAFVLATATFLSGEWHRHDVLPRRTPGPPKREMA